MKFNLKKAILSLLMCTAIVSSAIVYNGNNNTAEAESTRTTLEEKLTSVTKTPKYIFMFIGDGMSYPQFQAASDYLGAVKQGNSPKILKGGEYLSFMNFPVAGSATTYDSTSFCPDSASTATSISTGYKTYSGVINMDETKTVSYETVAEKLKDQLGYEIGVISSVNLNHATPAAFYAHQPSRNNYYEIGVEMVESDFDYFAGGGLLSPNGSDGTKESIYDIAKKAGYTIATTQSEAEKINENTDKAIVIGETLADSDSLSYENDRANSEWALADYVKKGIEVLDNDKGFFMMVEGGKIDWACHANDAGSAISDTIALSNAVDEAIKFYNEHPDETLILVTGDHETGGLTIGYAGTDYDTYLSNIQNQEISYAKYDSDYVAGYKENQTAFDVVLKDIEENFGLVAKENATSATNEKLILTDYEYETLKSAYEKTLKGEKADKENQAEYVLYGTYEPLTVTITHILNNKSGINFASYSHTGLPVAVFAKGAGQSLFEGFYDNTDIYKNLAGLLNLD